jgi:amidohydrolase
MNDSIMSGLEVPQEVFREMVSLRRDLHRHPELSGQEERTAKRITDHLERIGLRYQSPVGGRGVVAEIPGKTPGPFVALRADMDALPIHEETGLSFSSVHDEVMHACGHDGHSSMVMGAAELLAKGDPPPAPVRLIWQPSEEKGTGAQAMIAEGVLKNVAMIFGGHVDRHYPPGVLVVTEGGVNASTDVFEIAIHGQQGHGARPHETIDAVVVGSLLVTAIQTIVSREVDPAHPSVVSVGRFMAGTAPNVIAGTANLAGTIRSLDSNVRSCLKESIERIARAIGQLHGARIEVAWVPGTPPVINSNEMTALMREAASRVVGTERVKPLRTANMGGEDFSYYLQYVKGGYIRFGSQVPGREGFPAHSSRFDFDEKALATGAAWFAEIARHAGELLSKRR